MSQFSKSKIGFNKIDKIKEEIYQQKELKSSSKLYLENIIKSLDEFADYGSPIKA